MNKFYDFGRLGFLAVLALFFIACANPTPQQGNQPTGVPQQQATPQQAVQPGNTPSVVRAPSGVKANHPGGIEYLDSIPMKLHGGVTKAPVRISNGVTKAPVITWGADEATIFANGGKKTQPGSIFAREGLKLELFREDNFVRAVERFLSGETPYLRGTKDMIASAQEVLSANGIEVVEIYNHSRSYGGDTMVCRNTLVQKPSDLRGQYVGLQLYGPHMYFLQRILKDNGMTLNDVKIRWLRELTIPPYDTGDVAVDPMSAMQKDSTLACAMVISPDMVALTSGGKVGTGAESSVAGAYMLVSSKEADVIYDVYVVRKDYLDANRPEVQKFVHGLMVGAEEQVDLFNQADVRAAEYQKFVRSAALILRDNEQLTADIEGMYADMKFQKYGGNVQFYSGEAPRNFGVLSKEAEEALMGYGLVLRHIPLDHAMWDYAILAVGLRDTSGVKVPRFDPVKVQQYVAEPSVQARSGFIEFVVYFEAGEVDFSAEEYRVQLDAVIEMAPVYPGAIINIVAYADPGFFNEMKRRGASPQELQQIKTAAVNTSKKRADALEAAVLEHARERGVLINGTQLVPTGRGFDGVPNPNTVTPITLDAASSQYVYDPNQDTPEMKAQRADNRRLVFKFIPAVAEIQE